ncbi:MAG: glycerol acyltransferase [Caldilineae bacterium]|nr:MAG: glycerol acyltransferase [Caldilineae bacterium]
MQRLSRVVLGIFGWRAEVLAPLPAKCVIVGAHHTSNWDLIMGLLLMGATGYRFRWLAKDSVFWGPLGVVLRFLGGIPVNRRERNQLVAQMRDRFQEATSLKLAITPEGTRGETPYWKSGFYHIAIGAGVPLVLGYADYRRKVVGFGPILEPTGDIVADFEQIREFYADITGKYPRNHGIMKLKLQNEGPAVP